MRYLFRAEILNFPSSIDWIFHRLVFQKKKNEKRKEKKNRLTIRLLLKKIIKKNSLSGLFSAPGLKIIYKYIFQQADNDSREIGVISYAISQLCHERSVKIPVPIEPGGTSHPCLETPETSYVFHGPLIHGFTTHYRAVMAATSTPSSRATTPLRSLFARFKHQCRWGEGEEREGERSFSTALLIFVQTFSNSPPLERLITIRIINVTYLRAGGVLSRLFK